MNTCEKYCRMDGKVAIITGGARGIGYSLASALCGAGATTIIADLQNAEGSTAASDLLSGSLQTDFIRTNVTERASVQALFDRVLEEHGRIDVLVNCAGIIRRAPMIEVTDDDWKFTLDVNLYGTFLCSQIAAREMVKRRSGSIVNFASIVAAVAQRDQGVYAISKADVAHLTRVMAFELAAHGVRINAIAPGPTMTDLTRSYFSDHPDVLQQRLNTIPLGRLAEPDDFSGAVLFLATDASAFMTGQVLWIDGGFLLS